MSLSIKTGIRKCARTRTLSELFRIIAIILIVSHHLVVHCPFDLCAEPFCLKRLFFQFLYRASRKDWNRFIPSYHRLVPWVVRNLSGTTCERVCIGLLWIGCGRSSSIEYGRKTSSDGYCERLCCSLAEGSVPSFRIRNLANEVFSVLLTKRESTITHVTEELFYS